MEESLLRREDNHFDSECLRGLFEPPTSEVNADVRTDVQEYAKTEKARRTTFPREGPLRAKVMRGAKM
jgi:hypothetical protein